MSIMPTATGTATAIATLLDSAGNPIDGQTYIFSYQPTSASSATVWTQAGSVVTNSSGIASYQYSLPAGDYNFEASFAQTATYNASFAIDSSFLLRVNTTTTLVASSP